MECSAISPLYMGLGVSEEALGAFLKIKRECKKYNGDFTILWHNTQLLDEANRELYGNVLGQD